MPHPTPDREVECIECGASKAEADYPADWDYIGEVGSGAMYEAVDAETGEICLACRESWESHANTAVVVDAEGVVSEVDFKGGVMFDYSRFDPDLREAVDAVEDIVRGSGWMATDAWRGYHSVPDEAGDYSKVGGGWHSSVTRTEASDRINALTDGELHRHNPVRSPVIVVYTTTSNVMSTGVDIYAREDDEETVREFLSGASAGLDGRIEA